MKTTECTNCGEKNRITRIGFISARGYLCEACHVFYDMSGKARRVIKIEGSTNTKITFEQLIFEKKRKRKATGK